MIYFIRPHVVGITGKVLQHSFTVTKWDGDHDYPNDIYITNTLAPTCTCPSYRTPCKHIDIVNEWLKQENPTTKCWDDKAQEFIDNPFGDSVRIQRTLEELDNG